MKRRRASRLPGEITLVPEKHALAGWGGPRQGVAGKARTLARELATAADVSAGYLAEIETGRKSGSAAALARLAKALQVQIGDLIISSNG